MIKASIRIDSLEVGGDILSVDTAKELEEARTIAYTQRP